MGKSKLSKLKEQAFNRATQDCNQHGIKLAKYATMLRDLADALESYEDVVTTQASSDSTTANTKAARKGHIERKEIPKKLASGAVKTYPYYYLRYYSDGKLKSQYLGKDDPRNNQQANTQDNAA